MFWKNTVTFNIIALKRQNVNIATFKILSKSHPYSFLFKSLNQLIYRGAMIF